MKRHIVLLSLVFALFKVNAQEGKFLDIYGFGHQSSINNQYDLRYGVGQGLGRNFDYLSTFSYGMGAYYSQTSETLIGFKAGLLYSNYYQDIKSSVTLMREDTRAYTYTSEIRHYMLNIPLMIDFGINATDDERVFFHMGFGIQPMVLLGGNFNVEHDSDYEVSYDYDLYDYYRLLSLAYLLNAELKIKLGKGNKTYLLAGVNFDKSIGGIEHRGRDHGGSIPRELVFPLGALKDFDYDVPNDRAAYSTKNESIAIRVGISRRLSN